MANTANENVPNASEKLGRGSSGLSRSRTVGTEFKIVGKRIGAGNFGEVRIGQHIPTGEKVAVKIERIVQPKGVR